MSTVLEEFDQPTVNTAVYFTANITPIVRVNIEVCVLKSNYPEAKACS